MQRNIRHHVPGFEFVCVDGFAGVVFSKTRSQITGQADVSLVGKILDPENRCVVHPPSLTSNFGGRGKARLCLPDLEFSNRSTVAVATVECCFYIWSYGGHLPSRER